jgi:tRNA A-37 threonylcarbamoyl transferase component Bud32
MASDPGCPSGDLLERLVLGCVPGPQAEELERHVLSCSRCAATLAGLRADDTLVAALREARHAPPPPAAELADAMIPWLKRLRGRGETETQTVDTAAPPGDSTAVLSTFDFLAPPEVPEELGRIGPYRVLKVLGAGGMGLVFLAEDPRLKRRIAVKVIKPGLLSRPDLRERFLREAQAAAAAEHDHIVAIYQADEAGGVPFLAMPLLEGESLEDRLVRAGGPLPVRETLRIGREVAEALAAAHARGLVHRDIKPSNIFLEGGGGREVAAGTDPQPPRVKVLDFGLACLVGGDTPAAGAIAGTPAYMAPEQGRGQATDARADLFSVGCVLYRMTTGRPAFRGKGVLDTLVHVALDRPAPPRALNPAVPPALAALVERLLAKDPADRPPSARAVADALRAVERRLEPGPRRLPWLVGTAAALALGVGLTAWLASAGYFHRPEEPVEVTFDYDGPGGRLTLIRGDDEPREVDLAANRTVALPPGAYVARPAAAPEGLRLEPETFEVKAGEPAAVAVALVGEVRRHKGHAQTVWAVALSPVKGSLLALSVSGDRYLGVWDAAGEGAPKFLEGHNAPLRSVAFSVDGRYALTGGGDRGRKVDLSVVRWDVPAGLPVGRFLRHESWVTALAYTPGGKGFVSGAADGTAYLWDVSAGQPAHTLAGHDHLGVAGAAYSPDGRLVLTGGGDKLVLLWDTGSGQRLKRFEGHRAAVRAVAFAPDGRHAASADADGAVRVWDVQTGQAHEWTAHKGAVNAVAYGPDGKRLLTGGDDGSVRLWDAAAGTPRYTFAGHDRAVHGVAFSADGRHALSGGADRTVRLWALPK